MNLLFYFLLFLWIPVSYAETAKDLWEAFLKNPDAHETIPNNSFAGYKADDKVFDLRRDGLLIQFPAANSDGRDNVEIFESLLKNAPPDRGVTVIFPAGEYLFSRQLKIQRSKVRIKGAGVGKTTWKFTKPLWDIFSAKIEDGRSPFAWSRGLVEVSPAFPIDYDFNGWEEGKHRFNVSGAWPVGARKIQVNDKARLTPGMYLMRWRLDKKDVLSYLAGKPNDQWLINSKHWKNRKFLYWPVAILAKKGNSIDLAQPLRLPIFPTDQVDVYDLPKHLTQVEISDLTIDTNRQSASKHLLERGFNAIFFHRVVGGIVHNVEVKNVDNGFLLNTVKNISLSKIAIQGNLSTHHGTFHKYADDCLVEEFSFAAPMIHGLNADLRGSGNVWRAGRLKFGTIDMHRGMQFDIIRTNIEFDTNSGDSGGDADAGPMQGRRVVHWNLRVGGEQWKNIFAPEWFPFEA